jgi:hypothetical protein
MFCANAGTPAIITAASAAAPHAAANLFIELLLRVDTIVQGRCLLEIDPAPCRRRETRRGHPVQPRACAA